MSKKKAMRIKAKRIPRSARFRGAIRRWASSMWADVRGKAKTRRKSIGQTWPTCAICDRRCPPWNFDQCLEHASTCGCCCKLPQIPPQGGAPKKPPASKFKPGDPAREGHKTEKQQHEDQQAAYQAEIIEQACQETADSGAQEGGGEE